MQIRKTILYFIMASFLYTDAQDMCAAADVSGNGPERPKQFLGNPPIVSFRQA